MILPDIAIRRRVLVAGLRNPGLPIRIEPFVDSQVQPSSYDVRLGDILVLPSEEGSDDLVWDLRNDGPYEAAPGEFVLGCTLEWIEIPADLVGILVGKSTLARKGLQVEAAGYVDPGWKGRLTLEFVVFGKRPFTFTHGMKIAQIAFHEMTEPAKHPYGSPGLGSKYQGSQTTEPARE